MALIGLGLRIAGKVAKGVGRFIQKRKAKKKARFEKKKAKLAAKTKDIEQAELSLDKLGGEFLSSTTEQIKQATQNNPAPEPKEEDKVSDDRNDRAAGSPGMFAGLPVWLIPVALVAVLLFFGFSLVSNKGGKK